MLATSLAKAAAVKYGQQLSGEEMQHIMDKLFGCSQPSLSPDGKQTVFILTMDDLEKRFR
jgi:DNA mismatch repair protein MutL